MVEPVFGRVVLDANVLYRATLRDTLLRAAEQGLYRPVWSDQILDEMWRNLVEDRRVDESRSRLVTEMRRAFPRAEVGVPSDLIDQMTNAPEDRHVVAAAVVAGAEVIVTANLRDFGRDALAPFGVVALLPDTFLLHLFDADAAVMAEIVQAQAEELVKEPMTTEEVLLRLARDAPGFVARVRDVLG